MTSGPPKYTTFLMVSAKELGNDNVKPIKDELQFNVQTFLTTTIPQKIEEYKLCMQRLMAFTLDQVKSSIIIPKDEEIIADTKNRKFELNNFRKIKKNAVKEAKSTSPMDMEKTGIDEEIIQIRKKSVKSNGRHSASSGSTDSDDSDDDDDIFTMKFDGFTVRRLFPSALRLPSNAIIVQMIDIALKISDEMAKILTNLKVWLELAIPPMVEGGDNGGEIIHAHIDTILDCCEVVASVFDEVQTYRKNRYDLGIDLVTSTPGTSDRKYAFGYCDIDMFHKLRQCMLNAVQSFTVIYDNVIKNLNKLTNPRGKDTNSWLY